MTFFLISAVAIFGAWFILKDVPGGIVRNNTPNSFRFKPWEAA